MDLVAESHLLAQMRGRLGPYGATYMLAFLNRSSFLYKKINGARNVMLSSTPSKNRKAKRSGMSDACHKCLSRLKGRYRGCA